MLKLFVVADDFTGALDTGVQFAKAGVKVLVRMDAAFDAAALPEDIEVLVVDTESRHLGPGEAFDVVYDAVDLAVRAGIPHIYKKTDSGLRGNIGAELAAALEASGARELDFVPAFPQMNRLTIGGTAYIGGQLVEDSVFGKDPFNPVKHSSIEEIIHLQTDVPVLSGTDPEEPEEPVIRVFDISSEGELSVTAEDIAKKNGIRLSAGCAGFAEVLPEFLKLSVSAEDKQIPFRGGLLVGNGSVNPVSIAQLNHAETAGFFRRRLSVEEKLDEGFWDTEEGKGRIAELKKLLEENRGVLLDTNDPLMSEDTPRYVEKLGISRETMRRRISGAMGKLLKELLALGEDRTLLVMGGDTLQSFLSQVGVKEMRPLKEMLPGTVLSEFHWNDKLYHLLSKSGGFGDPELIVELEKLVR